MDQRYYYPGISREEAMENGRIRLKARAKELKNAIGFEVDIDTLTGIKAKVTEQVFYEIRPSDYVPIVVGENAYSSNILTYQQASVGSDFESSVFDTGSPTSKTELDDTQIQSKLIPTKKFKRGITYDIFQIQEAARAAKGGAPFSLIELKEKARFKKWQLGIQKVAFLGLTDGTVEGLLNNADVTNVDTTTIPKNITDMTETEFQTFLGTILGVYYDNTNSTVFPDVFVIPTDDYLGLGTAVSEEFNINSRLKRIRDSFKEVTSKDIKVLPLAYSQTERNDLGFNRYALYRYNEESMRMDIPIDYTTTAFDTFDSFEYHSVAFAQFTGLGVYRPDEITYFDHNL